MADPVNPGILQTAGEDVLYRSASGLEKSLATVEGQRLITIYAELIRDQWDPDKISLNNLPYLAWATGVNLWESDWDETFRRWWVKNQWQLKAQRGFDLGLKRFINAVSGSRASISLVRYVGPPQRAYGLRPDSDASIAFTGSPRVGDIITIGGRIFRFVDSGAVRDQANVRMMITATVDGLANALNDSLTPAIQRFVYAAGGAKLLISRRDPTDTDKIDISTNVPGATISLLGERQAYVARFPQLRLYPYVARPKLPWNCFLGPFQQPRTYLPPIAAPPTLSPSWGGPANMIAVPPSPRPTTWLTFENRNAQNFGSIASSGAELVGVPTFDASRPPALVLNGTTQYVDGFNNPVGTTTNTNVALSCWVNLSSASLTGCFMAVGSNTGFGFGVGSTQLFGQIFNPGNNLIGFLFNGLGSSPLLFATAIGTGWHHVVLTRDTTTWRGYIDGVVCTPTFTANGFAPDAYWAIGRDPVSLVNFAGGIRDARFYNVALSGADVAAIYATGPHVSVFAAAGTPTPNILTVQEAPDTAFFAPGGWAPVRIRNRNGAFVGPLRPLMPNFQLTDDRYTRTATIWDKGVETVLTVRKIVRINTGPTAAWGFTPGVSAYDEQVILPAKQRVDYYVGEPKRYLGAHGKRGIYFGAPVPLRTITLARSGYLDLTQGKAQFQTITPDVDLIEIRPETVAQRHPIRSTEAYAGGRSYLYKKFLPNSNAWQFYFERWYLFDPDRVPDVRRTGIYMNNCRFGIPPYQAEALVKIRVKRKKTIFANTNGWMYGFLAKADYEPIDKVRRAVIAARAARDEILIDTTVTRLRQAGDVIHPDGKHTVTEYVQN